MKTFVVDFISGFIFSFFTCAVCNEKNASLFEISATYALTAMTLFYTFASVTGGHVNPSVTLLNYVLGHVNFKGFIQSVIGQFAGSFAGLYALDKVFMKNIAEACEITAGDDGTQVFLIETTMTILMLMTWGSIWDKRNLETFSTSNLELGAGVLALAYSSLPYGGSFNLLRSLVPSIFMQKYDRVGLYLLSHLISITTVSIYYKRVTNACSPSKSKAM